MSPAIAHETDVPFRSAEVLRQQRPLEPERRRFYLSVRVRFLLTVVAGAAWVGFSVWLALPWLDDLGESISLPAAVFVIAGMAFIPGYLNMQLAASLLLDRPKRLRFDYAFPSLTLLLAAYNEEDRIGESLAYARRQDYSGELSILVVSDGSTDRTNDIVRRISAEDPRVRLLEVPHGGKARALDAGLATVDTPLVATIDADTLLMPYSLRRIVARLLGSPVDTVAVAGSVLTRNARARILNRIQQ